GGHRPGTGRLLPASEGRAEADRPACPAVTVLTRRTRLVVLSGRQTGLLPPSGSAIPASPRRSVCAPGAMAFSLYRRPHSPTGDAHHVDFPEPSRTPAAPLESLSHAGPPEAPVPAEARRPRRAHGPQHTDCAQYARQGRGFATADHHQGEGWRYDRFRP